MNRMNLKYDGRLTGRIIAFSRYLKDRGFRVFPSKVIDSLGSLREIDVTRKEDFFFALRTHFVTNDTEWKLFREYFEDFWNHIEGNDDADSTAGQPEMTDLLDPVQGEPYPECLPRDEEGGRNVPEIDSTEWAAYSPVPNLEKQDLSGFRKTDIQVAQLILKQMISLFKITTARRSMRSRKTNEIDFRRVTAKSLKTGGIPLELFYRKKKKRLKKLVVLADVSGSMDRYARFVIPFILGLKGAGSKAEVFVFSTSLTPVSSYLRRFTFDEALDVISRKVPDWSGGTRIGDSLRQFNEVYGERLLNRRTVVVMMSDGWDLGAKPILEREMETLKRKAFCILWLNPLPIESDSCQLAKGMKLALPYVDYFMPANSLESLRKVGRTLSRVMVHS